MTGFRHKIKVDRQPGFLHRILYSATSFCGDCWPPAWLAEQIRAAQAQTSLSRYARNHSMEALNLTLLRKQVTWPSLEKLFILGTGASRSQLSEKNIRQINAFSSVGINDSLWLDIIPTIELRERPFKMLGGTKKLLEQNAERIKAETRILVHISGHDSRTLPSWREEEKELCLLYSSTNPMTTSHSAAGEVFCRSAAHPLAFRKSVVSGAQASLLRALWIGVNSGFEEIILVGIDLRGHTGTSGPDLHPTAVQQNSLHIPVQDMVSSITRHGKKVVGFPRILIASEQSLLSSRLPRFSFD